MPEDMFQDDEEVLQGQMIRVQLSAKSEAGVYDLFDHQAEDAHQVASLNQRRIAPC